MQHQATAPQSPRKSLLFKALIGNAMFSTLSGLEMLFFPETMARFIGFSAPGQLRQLGLSLLLFAATVVFAATRRPIRLWAAGLISALDILWVVGTVALLLTRPDLFNTAGIISAALVALAVADFAIFQIIGIRRLTNDGHRRHDGTETTPLATAASR